MAVGEVKSVLDSESLRDAFTKTESVKRMRRHWDPSSEMVGVKRVKNYRQYGMEGTIAGIRADDENEEQERNEIFAFVVAGKTKIKAETIVDRFSRRASSHGSVTCPNVLAILEGRNAGYYRPFRCTDPIAKTTEPTLSFWTGDRVAYHDVDNSFGYLVHELFEAHTYGQTSSLQAFKRYLLSREDGVQRVIRVHALMGRRPRVVRERVIDHRRNRVSDKRGGRTVRVYKYGNPLTPGLAEVSSTLRSELLPG